MNNGSRLLLLLLLSCAGALPAAAVDAATEDEPFLPIDLTEEEKGRLHEIGMRHVTTAPPQGNLRNPAEWERSEGVLVRWPLGIPLALVAEMSEDVVVTTIVANATQETSARSSYTGAGVNMANVEFVHAGTNSIWVRDYGPWFIFADDQLGIVDHVYNRPRPLDDVIPQEVGSAWGIPVYGMDLIHTGGNYMSDGLGHASSTELVYNENPALTKEQVDARLLEYTGNQYLVLDYIQSGGIHHIDCWAKFLGPSTVLVKDVAPSDPTYDELNDRAAQLAATISPWGVPYTVERVFCPSGTWYTNSLILNDKVLVPLFGNAFDNVALQTYADAMPGYEVLGFTGSWATEDALHCRAMGVPDRGMLFLDHVPFRTEDIESGDYGIEARIVAASGQPLDSKQLLVHYSADGGAWGEAPLVADGPPGTYRGFIPAQDEDAVVDYWLEAADASGRAAYHPVIGAADPHRFTAICPTHPLVDVTPDGPLATCAGDGRLLTAELTGGSGPFAFQWLEDGVEIPGATGATYTATNAGTHAYNVRVWGDGCVAPRLDAEDVELTWQAEPAFAGLASAAPAQEATCAVDLAWAAAQPACGGPASYSIYRSTTPGFVPGPSNRLVAGLSGTTWRDSAGLEFGETYHYVVRAKDEANGVEEQNGVELSAAPIGAGGGEQVLFADDFEDAGAWADWTITTGPGPHTCGEWKRVATTTQRPPTGAGSYALADSDACGSGSQTSTDLESPSIDLDVAGLLQATLEFETYYRYWNGDQTTVEAWDGSAWHVVWTAPSADFQGHVALDVTPHAAGNPDFRVRFRYQNAAYDYWFAVDEVVVRGQVNAECVTASTAVSTVPHGGEGGTEPLRASRSGGAIDVTWDVATTACASSGYHLLWGWGADVSTGAVSGSDCTLGPSGTHAWTDSPDVSLDWVWFLVVGNDGAGTEGGWGTDSSGGQRSLAASGECGTLALDPGACLP